MISLKLRASLIAQLVKKNPPAMQEAQFNSWFGKIGIGKKG